MRMRKPHSKTFSPATLVASRLFCVWLVILTWQTAAWAQTFTSYGKGTPADSKAGQSSVYTVDKVENVSLANGNLSLSLPLVSVGGRGNAAYTVSLAYNSKLWSGAEQTEVVDEGFGVRYNRQHYGVRYDDGTQQQPGALGLGSGWMITIAPAIKSKLVSIAPLLSNQCSQPDEAGSCGYKYSLTRLWITLPDGAQVEMRDVATNGSPSLNPVGLSGGISFDRDRGRVWYSTDGSAITYISDAANGVVADQLSGWVFLADGTRLRMQGGSPSYGAALCSRIVDVQGNYLTIEQNVPSPGATTYTDQLGKQTILQSMTGGASLTVKGYNGAADRVIEINTGLIASADQNVMPVNLRSDYQSWQRPFVSGDINTYQGGVHATSGLHTDLFEGADSWLMIPMSDVGAVTNVRLLDGRSFRFRYNPFGELAEIVYPGGGTTQIDYQAQGSNVCEGGSLSSLLDRRVKERRVLTNGSTTEATWHYNWSNQTVDGVNRPTAIVEVRAGTSTSGALLFSEKHFFLALDAEYRFCTASRGSDGTGYERWDNAREFRTERETGSGVQITKRVWQQRAPVAWTVADGGLGYNAYVAQFGQEQPPNDPCVVQEDVILENGMMKRTAYGYDNFNNVTSSIEYDFGTETQPGAILRQTTRSFLASQNGYCYTNLNGLDGSCGGAIPTDMNAVIHQRRLMTSERVADAANVQKAYSEVEYDNSKHTTVRRSLLKSKYDK